MGLVGEEGGGVVVVVVVVDLGEVVEGQEDGRLVGVGLRWNLVLERWS